MSPVKTLIIAALAAAPSLCLAADITPESLAPQEEAATQNWSSVAQNMAQEVLISALSLSGIKYKYGGNSPDTGFDCSGFVRYVFKQAASLSLPHNARAISQLGRTISMEDLQPGDLVFFNTLKTAFSHVGIYLGDNRFIHSPSAGGGIDVVNMDDKYWAKRFNGARRLDSRDIQGLGQGAIKVAY